MMPAADCRSSTWWLTAAACWATLLAIASLSVITALPRNLINQAIPRDVSDVVRSIAPQGWSFFTRDARSANFSAWRLTSSDKSVSAARLVDEQASWAGLNRIGRVIDSQLMDLSGSLEGRWIACPTTSVNLTACLTDASKADEFRVRLRASSAQYCGPLLLVREEPIPWGYRNLVTEGRRSAAHVLVDCTV